MRVTFSIFRREIFCIDIERDLEEFEWEDEEEEEEEEEEEDEEEEEEEDEFLRWGEPAVFERNVFTP